MNMGTLLKIQQNPFKEPEERIANEKNADLSEKVLVDISNMLKAFKVSSDIEEKEIRLKDLNTKLSFKEEYPVRLEVKPEECIATLWDLNLYGTGDNEYEAISMLKREIVTLYSDIINEPDEHLGRHPKAWKRFLKKRIVVTDE